MRFGQPYMQRHEARLGAETDQRETESNRRPMRTQVGAAHGVEREMPAAALKNAKAQQDGDGTHMGNQQVEKPRPANFRNSMLRGDQKVRRQGHGFPRHHERVGVVGEQNEAHAGEKQMILQTEESRRRAFTLPEVACRKDRNARRRSAQQNQKYAREPIQTQMNG